MIHPARDRHPLENEEHNESQHNDTTTDLDGSVGKEGSLSRTDIGEIPTVKRGSLHHARCLIVVQSDIMILHVYFLISQLII